MAVLNGEKFIGPQIDSIVNQEGCRVELQVGDNGSTDSSLEILSAYVEKGLVYIVDSSNGTILDYLGVNYGYYAYSDNNEVIAWCDDYKKMFRASIVTDDRNGSSFYSFESTF
jgi:glycosyltransferase involved in cell wall biosynthesis